jgi:hypothetical protein
MARRCPADCRLSQGPYASPKLAVGDRENCLVRDTLCVVTGWSDAPIPWPTGIPVGRRSRPTLIVTEELARAVRSESAKALRCWWGASVKTVWRWRKALGVTRTNNAGTNALVREASEKGASQLRGTRLGKEAIERRRRTALELNLGRMLHPGYHGPRWTDQELVLLGTMMDEEVARLIGRSVNAVRVMRTRLGVPTARDGRLR